MSKKVSYILILSLVLVTVAGISIGTWNYTSQDKFIDEKTIILQEQSQAEMEINLSGICPGMTVSYEIHLQANENDYFDITLDFQKTTSDSLAQYIDVEIKLHGEKVDSAKLSDYLGGKQSTFPIQFDHTTAMDIEIVYIMGLDVGDEAQNTTADFTILLSAER